jgi:MFS transporter, PHS family, inorganic phosphate transporter
VRYPLWERPNPGACGSMGFGIGGDYPVSATIMSEYANQKNLGRMVSLVFSMQGLGLIVGPVLAIVLLSSGMSENLVWRLLLAFGAIPALSVFWMRRRLNETPLSAGPAGVEGS